MSKKRIEEIIRERQQYPVHEFEVSWNLCIEVAEQYAKERVGEALQVAKIKSVDKLLRVKDELILCFNENNKTDE